MDTSNKYLFNHNNYIRTKKINKKDIKLLEKEEKKKRYDLDERKRKKNNELLKSLMSHREEFIKFHKNKKFEIIKLQKAIKNYYELIELKKDKEDLKNETKRIQLLKTNNIDEYMKLINETKNQRLHYLLNQTDNYIKQINTMIEQQRMLIGTESNQNRYSNEVHNENAMKVDEDESKTNDVNQNATKNYMTTTHRVIESVIQPKLLKGGDLKEYQLSGLQWLVSLYNNNLNGILAGK